MSLFKRSNGIWYIKHRTEQGKWTQTSTHSNDRKHAEKFEKEWLMKGIQPRPIKISQIFNALTYEKSYICKRFIDILGDIDAHILRRGHINTYRDIRVNDTRHGKRISPVTVNDDLIFLKSVFNRAIDLGYMKLNPVKGVKFLDIPTKREIQVFSAEERKNIINNIQYKGFRNVVIFAFYSGCRIGEIVNLEWSDIDLKKKIITIGTKLNEDNKVKFRTKNKEPRYIHISKNLEEFLGGITKISEYIFTDKNNNRFNIGHISKLFKQELRKYNISDTRHFHSIRHTVITDLINKGNPLILIQRYIGHKYYETTLKYTHPLNSDIISISESIKV